jgi:AraC-like DNA-binding protein
MAKAKRRLSRPSVSSVASAIASGCSAWPRSSCPRRAGLAGCECGRYFTRIRCLSAVPHVVRVAKAEISVNDMSPSAGVSGRAFSERSMGASSLGGSDRRRRGSVPAGPPKKRQRDRDCPVGDEGAVGDRCDDAGHPVCAPSRAATRGFSAPAARWFRASAHASALDCWSLRSGTISRVPSRPAAAQRLSDLAWLRGVRDRIDREYAQPLDVEALARGAHMSAGHLSREFRLAYVAVQLPDDAAHRARDGAAASWRPQRHRGLLRGRLLVAGHLQQSLHRAGRRAAQRLSAHRGARDGGDPVVRRETGDQTDQESRSADPRAAASVTAMDITIHASFLPHDDPHASLAFYRDRPEVVVDLLLLRAGPG